MVQRMLWIKREFSLDLPIEIYPNLVERLRGTPARLEDRVATLPPEILTKRGQDDWSIQENVGPLLDLEPLWLGRLEDLMAGKKSLRPADMENQKTNEANHNAVSITYLLSTFRETRLRMVEQLDGIDESAANKSALHPRLNQPMRLIDLVFFIAEHDDHHLAQITALRKACSE